MTALNLSQKSVLILLPIFLCRLFIQKNVTGTVLEQATPRWQATVI